LWKFELDPNETRSPELAMMMMDDGNPDADQFSGMVQRSNQPGYW